MSNQRLHRAYAIADLATRSTSEGRIVEGYAVPYGEWTEITDWSGRYRERFAQGAFARSIEQRASKIKLLLNHDSRVLPVGRALALREDNRGLFGEFLIGRSAEGDELLALVEDGIVDAFSVSFTPVRDKWNGAKTEVIRLEAKLVEVSAVGFPAYSGAVITGTRAADSPYFSSAAERRWLEIERLRGN